MHGVVFAISENGVSDMMPNSNAGRETYSRKKVHPGEARFRKPLVLPQAKPMKIRPN